MQRFDVLLKIFGRAVFEAVEVEGGCLVKFQPQNWPPSLGSLLRPQDLKNGSTKYFKMYIKSLHFFQGLIQRIYHWGASKLIQI